MEKKDYFSRQSKAYAAYRPTYPKELYDFIFSALKKMECAWDCATGNGQVAGHLAKHFGSVYATDISTEQLRNAVRCENIHYSVSSAEQTAFSENQFDLITVGQALHWFNHELFYNEVRRTGRPGSLLAVWGYGLMTVDAAIDESLLDFYHNTVGPYWDAARRTVENRYSDIPFPFDTIEAPEFYIKAEWTRDHLAGYLSSWSATQKFILQNGVDPVKPFIASLRSLWSPQETRPVAFPIFMKLGKI